MVKAMFDLKEIFTKTWERFSKNVVFFIILLLGLAVLFAFALILSIVFALIPVVGWILVHILWLAFAIASAYCSFVLVKSAIAAYNGETIDWDFLKPDMNVLLKYFAVSVITAIAFSLIALIFYKLPTYLIGPKLWLLLICTLLVAVILIALTTLIFPVFFMIVDKKDIGIAEAFMKSVEITKPQFVNCLIFILIVIVSNVIGFLALGIGLFVTIPMSCIATAAVYKKLDVKVIQK